MVTYLVRGEIDPTQGADGLQLVVNEDLGSIQPEQMLEAFRLYVSLHSELLEVTDDLRVVPTGEVVDVEIYIQQAYGLIKQIARWGNLDWKEFVPEEFQAAVLKQMEFEDELNKRVWGASESP